MNYNAISNGISTFANLPLEVADIVRKYAQRASFPWEEENYTIGHGNRNCRPNCGSDSDGRKIYETYIRSSESPIRYIIIEIFTASVHEPKKLLTNKLIVQFHSQEMLKIYNYLKENDLLYSIQKIPVGDDDMAIITADTKQKAEFLVSILEEIPKFPSEILEETKKHIDTLFTIQL